MVAPRTALRFRMALSLLGLLVVTLGFALGVVAVITVGFTTVWGATGASVGPYVAALVLVGVAYAEYRGPRAIERLADAEPVDPATEPALEQAVVRAATQLDVPVPTVALSDRSAPEALVVGLRPGNAHLVLSRGTVDALDEAELAAVVAHELAHVANRDAMVMTAVSLPVVLAEGLRGRLHELGDGKGYPSLALPLVAVAVATSVAGRTVLSRLSRAREQVADRAAAAVTGSPAALASALRTLDTQISSTPERDLRQAASVSALSVLPLDPKRPPDVMLGADGEMEPSYGWVARVERRLFGTHPPTAARVEALETLEREMESD